MVDFLNTTAVRQQVHQLRYKASPEFIQKLDDAINEIIFYACEIKKISRKVILDKKDVNDSIIKYIEMEIGDLLTEILTDTGAEDLIGEYMEKYGEDEKSKKLWDKYNYIFDRITNFRVLKEFDEIVSYIKEIEDKAKELTK